MEELMQSKLSTSEKLLCMLVLMDDEDEVMLQPLIERYNLSVGQTNRDAIRLHHNGLNQNNDTNSFRPTRLMLELAGHALPPEEPDDEEEDLEPAGDLGGGATDLDDEDDPAAEAAARDAERDFLEELAREAENGDIDDDVDYSDEGDEDDDD